MWKQGIFLIAIIFIANVHAKGSLEMSKPSGTVLQAIQVFLKKQDLSNDQIAEVTKLLSTLKQEYLDYQAKSVSSLDAKYKECEADVNTLECRFESDWTFNVKELTRGIEDINLNKLPSLNATLEAHEADVKRQQALIDSENTQLKEKTEDLNLEVEVVQKAIDLISSYYKLSSFVQLYSKLNNALNKDDRRSFLEVAKSLDETYNQVQERSLVSHYLKGSMKNNRLMAQVNSLTSLLQKQSENGYDNASQIESAQHVVNLLKKLVETIKAAIASEEKESKETNEVYQKTIDTVNSKIEEVKKNIAEYEASALKNKEEIEKLDAKLKACQGKPKSIEGDCAQYNTKSTEINIEVNEIVKQIDEILVELESLKL